ncbi:hypothetical protein KA107_01505 [Candidatus Pacearchaeota archaeon]|nr:hypothetical protein [Candidatus Pacearchaeota archaeon]
MVSAGLKAKFAAEKTRRAGLTLLPIFKKEYVSDFTNEILREDEELRQQVMLNPSYRSLLESKVAEIFKSYRGVLTGSKLVDSWDRVTSAIGLVGDAVGPLSGGLGYLVSAGEEIPELIPKAVYAIYYGIKTKDLKAIPYWTAMEAASFIPYIGDAIDMSNIYVNRARKATKEKVKKEMRKILPSKLESKAEEATT